MSQLGDLVLRARQEFAQNPRLRIGVIAIATILALYAFLVLRDWRTELHANYVERREHLRDVRALAVQKSWPARAKAMSRLRKGLEAQIPTVGSLGLAQAGAQAWARDLTSGYPGTTQVQPQEPQQVENQPGLWRIPVTISGSLPPKVVINLIQQIEKRTSLSVIEQSMLLNRENKTFELTVVSYARVAGSADNASR